MPRRAIGGVTRVGAAPGGSAERRRRCRQWGLPGRRAAGEAAPSRLTGGTASTNCSSSCHSWALAAGSRRPAGCQRGRPAAARWTRAGHGLSDSGRSARPPLAHAQAVQLAHDQSSPPSPPSSLSSRLWSGWHTPARGQSRSRRQPVTGLPQPSWRGQQPPEAATAQLVDHAGQAARSLIGVGRRSRVVVGSSGWRACHSCSGPGCRVGVMATDHAMSTTNSKPGRRSQPRSSGRSRCRCR
jgi:hypothetical protein